MNSKEIVRRTFTFASPERVAHSFYPSDFIWCGAHISGMQNQWKRVGEKEWTRIDEWGNTWHRTDSASRGRRTTGGLQNLSDSKDYKFPDLGNPDYYTATRTAFDEHPDKWHIGLLSGSTFEIANSLTDHYISALYSDLQDMRILHGRIDSLLQAQILNFKKCGADSVMIVEDLAETFQVPPGPTLWREEFRPRLQKICDYSHTLGLSVIMHSLEQSSFIIDLIEAGIDCIEIDTPQTSGIDALQILQEKYQITFWCPVDIHTTLQSKSESVIRKEAHEMIDKLWKGTGGFIAGYYWDNQSIGLSPEWQEYANDEFVKYGKSLFYQ